MTGAIRKMAVYLGLVEDDAQYQDEYDSYEEYEEYEEGRRPDYAILTALYVGAEQTLLSHEPAYDVERGLQRFSTWLDDGTESSAVPPTSSGHRSSVQPTDVAHITTLYPRAFDDARIVGEHLREGTPVIMNLTEMTDSDAKRLVDFAAGLIFGLRGSMERVATKVFLLSPANVEVKAWQLAHMLAQRGDLSRAEKTLQALAMTGDEETARRTGDLLAEQLTKQGREEEAERLRRFDDDSDGSIASA
jgi:cell division inhibitor SepF